MGVDSVTMVEYKDVLSHMDTANLSSHRTQVHIGNQGPRDIVQLKLESSTAVVVVRAVYML